MRLETANIYMVELHVLSGYIVSRENEIENNLCKILCKLYQFEENYRKSFKL